MPIPLVMCPGFLPSQPPIFWSAWGLVELVQCSGKENKPYDQFDQSERLTAELQVESTAITTHCEQFMSNLQTGIGLPKTFIGQLQIENELVKTAVCSWTAFMSKINYVVQTLPAVNFTKGDIRSCWCHWRELRTHHPYCRRILFKWKNSCEMKQMME